MVAVKVQAFGGMIPAVDDMLLPDNAAALAQNTWLYDGKITGMRLPRLIYTCVDTNTKFVYRIPKTSTSILNLDDSYWMEFESINTSVVKGAVSNVTDQRYYWTDGVNPPRYNLQSRIAIGDDSYILGVPVPSVAPTATPAGGVSGVTETRSYVYTHVTDYGEEGPPSPPSIVTTGKVDDTWALTMTAIGGDATDRNITLTRIYRTITSDQGNADYYFVAELPVATLVYNDVILSDVVILNEPLITQLYDPPPLLDGFTTMPNGMIIGWMGSDIWFCEPYRPHAWPVTYQQAVEFPVVGIGVIGQTAVILTKGVPYTCTGNNPANVTLAKIQGLSEPCTSRGSIVTMPEGVAYSSPTGIILVGPGGGANLTHKILAKSDWQELLNVASLNAAMLERAYYTYSAPSEGVFEETAFDEGAFVFEDTTGTTAGAMVDLFDARVAFNQLITDVPIDNVFKDAWTNEVFILREAEVYHIDTTNSSAQSDYVWRSKIYQMPRPCNLSVAKIYYVNPDTDQPPTGVFKVYGESTLIMTKTIPASGIQMRLPAGKKYVDYQFEITGNLLVTNMQVASTAKELQGV